LEYFQKYNIPTLEDPRLDLVLNNKSLLKGLPCLLELKTMLDKDKKLTQFLLKERGTCFEQLAPLIYYIESKPYVFTNIFRTIVRKLSE